MNAEYSDNAEQQLGSINPAYLIGILEGDENLKLVTAFRMALTDLKDGDIDSAIWRLKSDMDKMRGLNPDLYQYLRDRL